MTRKGIGFFAFLLFAAPVLAGTTETRYSNRVSIAVRDDVAPPPLFRPPPPDDGGGPYGPYDHD